MALFDYGFGYDPEVPGGFQDADLEMAELEESARDYSSRDEGRSDGQGESYAERNV
jgi:hypothetical protein